MKHGGSIPGGITLSYLHNDKKLPLQELFLLQLQMFTGQASYQKKS